jgi:uncharacterized protein YcgL (UPF0745 family)
MLCQVFRSPRREQMYLYVSKQEGLARVPEALLQRFGEPEPIMMLKLDGSRKLARADAQQVAAEIRDKGFYLQMPPGPEELRRAEL